MDLVGKNLEIIVLLCFIKYSHYIQVDIIFFALYHIGIAYYRK